MSKGKQRQLQKLQRREGREAKRNHQVESSARFSRTSFSAKSRRGDKAEVRFDFSGVPVPFGNGEQPCEGLKEQTEVVRAFARVGEGKPN